MSNNDPLRDPEAIALALHTEAEKTGRLERERSIVERFDRLSRNTGIDRRPLLVAVSGKVIKTPAVEAVRRWAAQRRRGLFVLSGPLSTGKTVAAADYACRTGAEWVAAATLGLMPHGRAWGELERLRGVDALVLDEVGGQGTTTPHAVDRIASLLSWRFADFRPTVITTNLNRADFAEVYDGVKNPAQSRLLERVREAGQWHTATGPNMRDKPVEDAQLIEGRVDLARSFVRLMVRVEAMASGAPPHGPSLAEAQSLLGLTDADVVQRIEGMRKSRERLDSIVAGVADKWVNR